MNKYQEILKQYWGYDSFRDLQEEIITSIGEGKDTLGLMPTGGGKSITFQVPALAQEGICIVITPLIALMKDQVQNLRKRGIKALAVYSGMTRQEILTALENCIFGNYKFLYISPERLDTDIFRTKLRLMKVSMITVDESHCISQWGYDFRPAYLKIAEIRTLLPGIPVLALTATATPEVVKDIQARLEFREENVFRMSFERKNLAYIVRQTDNKTQELLHILRKIPGSAIIYVRNRRRTKEITELLVNEDITADFYHAGLDNAVKDLRQKRWQSGEVRVMVATNAFGMGIDKPDVRIVLHLDLPDSLEAYFQEAGRAGRDGEKAYAVILYTKTDRTTLHRRVVDTFPDKEYILNVYEHLQYYYQMAMGDGFQCVREFNLEEFCRKFKYFPVPVDSALKILTQAGYLEYTDEQDNASRILFTIRRDELYKLREMGTEAEVLIQTILRSYTGVFTDYAYISEATLSIRTGLTREQIYNILVTLTKRRIVDYIPHKKTPYIIYTRERQELRFVHIPPSVYEERKARYEARIKAMEEYVTSENVCRSRMLLRYFGEKNEHNCGQCDVCLSHRATGALTENSFDFEELKKKISELLTQKPLTPVEIIRSAMLLRETVPYLEENAERIRKELDAIARKKNLVEKQFQQISKQKQVLEKEHERMKLLVQRKSKIRNAVEIKSERAKRNMDKLASQAQDLRDLLGKLEAQRQEKLRKEEEKRRIAQQKAEEQKRLEAKNREEKQTADLIKSQPAFINETGGSFIKAKGKLPLPARGQIVTAYGEQKVKGVSSKGIIIKTRDQAQVISPFDGTVIFSGPFRGYGNLIIIEHGEGYLTLLAGLKNIDVDLGQMLLAGEPVGQMPDDGDAKLYVELRKNNQPIDPMAWMRL